MYRRTASRWPSSWMTGLLNRPCQTCPMVRCRLVVAGGMGDGQQLDDAADRLARLGTQQQVEVVGHQAIPVEAERVSPPGPRQGLQEGFLIGPVVEDGGPVVAPVQGVVDQVIDWPRETSHAVRSTIPPSPGWGPLKITLVPEPLDGPMDRLGRDVRQDDESRLRVIGTPHPNVVR